jgi:hypothetical protein
MILAAKAADREEKMCPGGIPKVSVKNFRFSLVPTVAKI